MHRRGELVGEATLPDPGRSHQGGQVGAPLADHAGQDQGEKLELGIPSDHGGLERAADCCFPLVLGGHLPGLHRPVVALHGDLTERPEREGVPRISLRSLAHHDRAR